ncbi:MAG: nucleoside diphosphate kinase regulator [Burkholderiales bacterium]|jgi:regulator of nucleoside diphosphate kinase|nr:nucleoside diphosphate kinase regulator [Burkholderiales bacterium]
MQQNIRFTAQDHQRLSRLVIDLGRYAPAALSGAEMLAELLDTGRVLPPQDIPDNVVTMNSQVLYQDLETGELREARVVYPEDADPAAGRISVLSPVGASLLGLAAGDETVLPLPHGRSACIRICKVVWQPEAQGEFAL